MAETTGDTLKEPVEKTSEAPLDKKSKKASKLAATESGLKQELIQGYTATVVGMGFLITICTSYQFGYNIGVLNQPVSLIKDFINQSYSGADSKKSNSTGMSDYSLTTIWSLVTTLYVVGGMIGAFALGFIADKIGRKRSVMVMAVPSFFGGMISFLCVLGKSPVLLLVGRFITGLACGAYTQIGPMYLIEISPFNLKGAMGTSNQLFITIGILMASIFGLSGILGTIDRWPYLLLLNIFPSILAFIAFPFLPESPRYLMMVKKNPEATKKALRWLRKRDDVSAEIKEMEEEAKEGEQGEKFTVMKLFRTPELISPLIIAVMLQVIQQLSGINAIFFYSTGIYKRTGIKEQYVEFANVGTCAVNVFMTIVALPLMDRAGRRSLLLIPMVIMIIVMGILTAALKFRNVYRCMNLISIGCIITYVICFAIGLGPIPCMITAELFRQEPRGTAMSIAGLTNWVTNAMVAMGFELIQELIEEYVFLIFLFILVFSFIFILYKVPETKNKTFDEIAKEFGKSKKKPLLEESKEEEKKAEEVA